MLLCESDSWTNQLNLFEAVVAITQTVHIFAGRPSLMICMCRFDVGSSSRHSTAGWGNMISHVSSKMASLCRQALPVPGQGRSDALQQRSARSPTAGSARTTSQHDRPSSSSLPNSQQPPPTGSQLAASPKQDGRATPPPDKRPDCKTSVKTVQRQPQADPPSSKRGASCPKLYPDMPACRDCPFPDHLLKSSEVPFSVSESIRKVVGLRCLH